MPDSLEIRLDGVDAAVKALRAMPRRIREKAIRNSLKIAARLIRDDAKARAPVLANAVPHRTPGTVKRRISVRTSKFAKQAGDEGVFIGIKPLRGKADTRRYGKASAKNPNDPYYWRFLEFGTRKMGKRPFLGPAAKSKGEQAVARFMREALPQIEKLNKKAAV